MGTFKTILVTLTSLILLQLLSVAFSLRRRYRKAQKIGLPVVWSYVSNGNPIFLRLQRLVHSTIHPVLRGLSLSNMRTEPIKNSFIFRSKIHEELGEAFVLVSPGSTLLIVAEPRAAEQILSHRKAFIKSPAQYRMLDFFGKNVVTANGEAWQRHRRITAPPFNERNSNLVWKTALAQAGGMIKFWAQKKQGIISTWHDAMTLALNVLLEAGLGKPQSSDSFNKIKHTSVKAKKSFTENQRMILDHLGITILTSRHNWLPLRLFPSKWSETKQAAVDFRVQMQEMVDEEQNSIREREVGGDSLLSALLSSSKDLQNDGEGRNSLSNDEIIGNLFIYNLAGHDTTANTMAYAFTILSINPKYQVWLREEINTMLPKVRPEKWEYEKAYPQLKRCLALMYEVLRLYPPVLGPRRSTGPNTVPFTIGGKEYIIPPKTTVAANITDIHVNSKYWGSDALEFRPDRWIISSSIESPQSQLVSTNKLAQTLASEHFITPLLGTFMPWTSGPRICPGMKFSKVEFVAVMACLIGKYRVEPISREGESKEEVVKRVHKELEDSETKITLKMKGKENVTLRWVGV